MKSKKYKINDKVKVAGEVGVVFEITEIGELGIVFDNGKKFYLFPEDLDKTRPPVGNKRQKGV